MKPQDFITKWSNSALRERAGAHSHFIDLCRLLDEKAPSDADPKGEWYAFEKGALKTGGGDGWADVWKRGCFAWEYKSPGKDLNVALKQLQYYVRSLENPPLLIVSDMETIEMHTNWTNMVQATHEFKLPTLVSADARQKLKWAFSEATVEQLKPGKTREALTKEVAEDFVKLAQNLRERGHEPEKVAHFVNRMVFCMFAEDVDLLPDRLFKRMLEASVDEPGKFVKNAQLLFAAMRKGGDVGFRTIDWFNGGIFNDDTALPLTKADIKVALAAANRNWSNIDPSIMGTLFERGLDPGKRSQLGAHYTDPEKIMLIVNPVIVEPLTREWEAKRAEIEAQIHKMRTHKSKGERTKAENEARRLKTEFLERLNNFRVLDPACGSGNFLYLALKELKNIEHRVNVECEQMGLERGFPVVGPECVKGIEINPFAAELARVSVWIGEIQWMREHGFDASRNPILKPLETIECRDALLSEDGSEAEWPRADVIIGNPPFLGAKRMRSGGPEEVGSLGDQYVDCLRTRYDGRLPDFSDYVCYWFEKARAQIVAGAAETAGLVATNSIRGGANRVALDRIAEELVIFNAWSDEPWVVEGAAVRVSLVCFGEEERSGQFELDGQQTLTINPDLTGSAFNLTLSGRLQSNASVAFIGIQPSGPFQTPGETGRAWLLAPTNPNGRKNGEVVKPYINGLDVTRRPQDIWIVDFGDCMSCADAALYEAPFKHLEQTVRPIRKKSKDQHARDYWWLAWRPRPEFRSATSGLTRYLATARVAKHRLWIWLATPTLPDSQVVAIARDDDTTFGILHSRFHELWSLRMCTWLGVGNDPRYTPTTCFETFPFPDALTPDIPAADYAKDPRAAAIAKAATRLNELRENWLNPPELVKRVPEVVPGYPDRILPVDDNAAAILKKRTLTNLYNERPAWLDNAHRDLDAAVAAAYDWPGDLTDEQILERLFNLNQTRAAKSQEQ